VTITYLKKSPKTSFTDDKKTASIVEELLKDIEQSKEQGCIRLTKKFDKYDGDIIVSKEKIEEIKKKLDQKTKDDVQFSSRESEEICRSSIKKLWTRL
jgi:sulfopropanediol 3-dehydrogenase